MPLTETKIRALRPRDAGYKVTDEKGLYLLVTPAGGRLWKLKFRAPGGPEKKLSIGSYPDISLKEARERRDEARKQLANGVDPAAQKRRDDWAAKVSASNTFNAVAEAFIAKCERDGLAANTIIKRRWFTRLVHKAIGNRRSRRSSPSKSCRRSAPLRRPGTMRRPIARCSSSAVSSGMALPTSLSLPIQHAICGAP
jgi:hypothetical protein